MWCWVRKDPLVQFDFAPCGPSSVTPDGVPPSPEGEGMRAVNDRPYIGHYFDSPPVLRRGKK